MSTGIEHAGNNITERFIKARGYACLNQKSAAAELGISSVTMNRYEKGSRVPDIGLVKKMAEIYGVSPGWLLSGEGEMIPDKKITTAEVADSPKEKPAPFLDNNIAPAPLPSYKSRQIPVISFVQAGEWTEAVDLFQPGFADDWVVTAETDCPYAFALKVVGDSMEPKFQEGDIIVVDPEKAYVSGSYVIAKNGDEATFKQLILDPPQTFLKPLNERYPIRDMTGKNLRIVGVVVERKTKF